jgi:tRNA A-37 threonylcarbamoyl transferase component Bud32
MMREMARLGYVDLEIPPYNLLFKGDMKELPGLIGDGPLPGKESPITGRAGIRIIEPDLVVRVLTHGGLLRHITGNRFLTLGRSLREMAISAYLISHKVPTPEIVALRYKRNGFFYTIEVISRLVPGAYDLLTYLEGLPGDALLALMQAGALISRMHGLGVYHFDLHVKNILLDKYKSPWIIDLDNAYRFTHLPMVLKTKNLARFRHSLRKWDGKGRIHLPEGWELAFMEGYSSGK